MATMRVFLVYSEYRIPPKVGSKIYFGEGMGKVEWTVDHVERRVHVYGDKHMQTAGWDVWLYKE